MADNNFKVSPQIMNVDTPNDSMIATNSISNEELIAKLMSENAQAKQNLIGQRDIINSKFEETKAMEARIKELEKENAELKQATAQPAQNNFEEEFKNIRAELDAFKQRDLEAQKKNLENKLIPIIDMLAQRGVSKENVENVFSKIKQVYNVDLVNNPDDKLANAIFNHMFQEQEPSALPQGGYTPQHQATPEEISEANYKAAVEARRQ